MVVEFDVLVVAVVSSKEKRLFRKHETDVLREDFWVNKAVSDCVTSTSIPPSNRVDVGLVDNRASLGVW